MGKNFRETLNERLRDPGFEAEWDALEPERKQAQNCEKWQTMLTNKRNYVYMVKVTDSNRKEPTISLEYARQCQAEVEKYLRNSTSAKTKT